MKRYALIDNDLQKQKMMIGIERAIMRTFKEDRTPLTQSEVKRRFEIAKKIWQQLRGDCHWGVDRIVDSLYGYLRAEIDGDEWKPDTRAVWMPEDGN